MAMFQPGVALFHAHFNAMRIAIHVEPAPIINAGGLDHKCVSFPPAHRVSVPPRVGPSGLANIGGEFASVQTSRQTSMYWSSIKVRFGNVVNVIPRISWVMF